MKKSILIVSILSAVLIFSSFKLIEEKEELCTITIKVNGLRNSKGVVQYSIYDKDGTIPDEDFKKYFYQKIGSIKGGNSTMTFVNMPKGRYAVNILHDENKDGKIDKGYFLPIEGIGFTNYSSIGLMNRPNFKKASFEVNNDVTKTVKIIYM
jgi:uncharacterized protein (DUF2141 family)